jgi:opacity protein-like surface antigen
MKKLILLLVLLVVSFTGTYAQTPISIGANAGGDFPMGTFTDVYKGGVSGEFVLLYSLPAPGLDLSLTVGYNGMTYKNEYFTSEFSTNLGVSVDNFTPEWKATDIPVMVGARYKFPAKGATAYMSGEIGMHFVNFDSRFNGTKMTCNSSSPATINNLSSAIESASESGFGFALGAGCLIDIAPKFAIDLGVKYNYGGLVYSKAYNVFRNSTSQYTSEELKNISFVTARIGAIIKF